MRTIITIFLIAIASALALPAQISISPSTPSYGDEIILNVDTEIPADGVDVDSVDVIRNGNDIEVVVDMDVNPFQYDPDGTSQLQFSVSLGTFPPGDYTITMVVEVFGIPIYSAGLPFSVPVGTSLEIQNLIAHLVDGVPLAYPGDVNTDGDVDAADLVTRINNLYL